MHAACCIIFKPPYNVHCFTPALCGRNKEKLEALKYGCNCPADVQIFVAEADDFAAIEGLYPTIVVTSAHINAINPRNKQNKYNNQTELLSPDSFCEAHQGGLRVCRAISKIQRPRRAGATMIFIVIFYCWRYFFVILLLILGINARILTFASWC